MAGRWLARGPRGPRPVCEKRAPLEAILTGIKKVGPSCLPAAGSGVGAAWGGRGTAGRGDAGSNPTAAFCESSHGRALAVRALPLAGGTRRTRGVMSPKVALRWRAQIFR